MIQPNNQREQFLWNACPLPGCLSLVESKNFLSEQFSEQNIQFNWIDHSAGPDVLSGDYPRLFRHGGVAQPIAARALGARFKIIGIEIDHNCHGVAVLADSSIKSMRELKGKRLAVVKGMPRGADFIPTEPYLTTLKMFETGGLNDGVEYVDIKLRSDDLPPTCHDAQAKFSAKYHPSCKALFSKEVDAIYTSFHQAGELLIEGKIRMLFDTRQHPGFLCVSVTTVPDEILERYPDIVKQFLMVQIKAGRWARAHRSEAIEVMAQSAGVTEEAIIKGFSSDFHMHLVPEFTEENINALGEDKEFMRRHGLIKNDFNIETWLEPKFLDQALRELGD